MKSLRTRALVAVTLVVVVVLIGLMIMARVSVMAGLQTRFDTRMPVEAQVLSAEIRRRALEGSIEPLTGVGEFVALDRAPASKGFAVWIDGRLAVRHDNYPADAAAPAEGFTTFETSATSWRIYARRESLATAGGERSMLLAISESLPARQLIGRWILSTIAWTLLLVLVLITVGIYLALGWTLAPIHELAQQIRNRSAEDLQPIATTNLPSEMSPIVESVNHLMTRVGASLERERRFTADAAHELRTPLTALKTHAQVALHATDDQQRSQMLRRIVRIVDRTNRQISQLLTLARLDPQAPRAYVQAVDLAAVTCSTVLELQPAAEIREQVLRVAAGNAVVVTGGAEAIGVLVRNLVENAIQYSDTGMPIDVRVYRDGDRGVVEIEDRGPGIAASDRADVFRRFWRAPGTKGFGTGLGLSIVQRVIELHGGEISLSSGHEGVGLRVLAAFPVHSGEHDAG